MAINREISAGRRTCRFGNHQPCSACGDVIQPHERHSHTFHTHKNPDQLCAGCNDLAICAAKIFLEALERAGFNGLTAKGLYQAFNDERIGLMIFEQTTLLEYAPNDDRHPEG